MKYKLLILAILFISCNDDRSQKDEYIKELEEKNKQLTSKQSTPITTVDTSRSFNSASLASPNDIGSPTNGNPTDQINQTTNKYAFVLLSIVKKEFNSDKWREDLDFESKWGGTLPNKGYEYINYYVASKIESFGELNEDQKFKFIDEVQSELKNSTDGFNIESIKKRKCLVFNSYKSASIERAKYITEDR